MAKKNPENLRNSKEKKLQTSEKNRYKALFEHSISALFIGKPDGSILEANDAACNMFGYSVEELRQLGRQGIIAPDTPALKEKLKEREENSGVTGELIGIRKNGERFWCEFSSSIFEGPNGEKLSSVMMIDISDKKQAEVNLKLNEINRKKLVEELSRVFSSAPDIICTAGFDGYFKKINPAASELLGYSEEELLSQPFINFVHPEDVQKTVDELSVLQVGKSKNYIQNRYITKSGKIIWLSWTAKIFYEEEIVYAVAKDITDQKELELLHDQATRLARIGSWELDVTNDEVYWSKITKEIHEADPDYNPVLEEGLQFYKEGESRENIIEALKKAMEHGTPWDLELQIVTAKGNERWVRTIGEAEIVDGTCVRIYGSFQDIHERKESQKKIISKTRQLDAVARFNGLLIQEMDWMKALEMCLEDFGKAALADRVYFFENDKLEEDDPVTTMRIEWVREGIQPQIDNPDHQNLPFSEIHSFIQTLYEKRIYNHRVDEIPDKEFNQFLQDQDIRSLLAFPVFTGDLFRGFIGFDDCTIRKVWNQEEVTFLETIVINLASAIESFQADIELRNLYEELELKVKALAASNAELEQFAFVASHDLQEPLRMITSFLALIEQKYGDKLDEKGRSYIYFATDGARRMRNIILDLLEYSRVGKVEVEKTNVDLNEIIDVVISLNKKIIEEKEAQINWDDFPTVYAVKNQIQQLFQNLIQNAIHYQKPDQKPVIQISCEETPSEWKLSVEDNGIGIHPDYKDKIFNIFQRLHSNEEFSGTGVGLAICKKIVEENGGSIGVESEEDNGSTFYFTIPKRDLNDVEKES